MRDYINEFLDAKAVEKGASLNTLKAYKNDVRQFFASIPQQNMENITTEDIEQYLKELKDKGSTAKTLSRKISCIREFFKFLQSENIIKESPANRLRTPKIGKSLPYFLTAKEVKKIYTVAKLQKSFAFMKMYVMVKLMYSAGLRVSELVSLPENAINYDMQQILICGKGSKERIVPITKEVIGDILEYLNVRDKKRRSQKGSWLFPSEKSLSGHVTRNGFFKSLKKLAAMAGISPEKVHPHILRHSFATRLVNNNADLRSIQKMLGHENITTTEIYTHITTERLIDEVKKRHPLTQQREENK